MWLVLWKRPKDGVIVHADITSGHSKSFVERGVRELLQLDRIHPTARRKWLMFSVVRYEDYSNNDLVRMLP